MMAARAGREPTGGRDAGSVSPLIIGMMVCLLVLGAAVTAAGSAFLAKRRVQAACDSATTAVAASVAGDQFAAADDRALAARVSDFLRRRYPGIVAEAAGRPGSLLVGCRSTAEVTFGALFGTPRMTIDVRSVARVRSG